MTTYVYETIPATPGEKARYFEIRQTTTEAPLTRHPETGEPIRRVVLGGFGVLSSKPGSARKDSSCGCAPGESCG
ncbi:MAG: zinc ribbon domain-containing protein [Verrucomicrobiales bacterium]|nr:zinc ribbon domain-containing protein [Verrucomicrobiales bacterium]